MSGMKRSALAVLAVVLSTACATGYETERSASYAAEPMLLDVANYHWSDMTIYMVTNGMRSRLGTVTSMSKATFRLPAQVVSTSGSVHLLADPIGSSQTHLSPPLLIQPGQRAEWRLEHLIQLSSLLIR